LHERRNAQPAAGAWVAPKSVLTQAALAVAPTDFTNLNMLLSYT